MAKRSDKRKAFVLYNGMQDDIRRLTMAQRGELLTIVFDYSKTRIEPEIADLAVGIVFDAWKRWLDADFDHYEEVSKARSESGRRGGAPKGNQNARKKPLPESATEQAKQTSGYFVKQNEQNQPKQAINNNNNSNNNRDNISFPPVVFQDTDLGTVLKYYSDNFNPQINSSIASLIQGFLIDMTAELIIEAIRECLKRNVRAWNYLWAILKDWRGKGYKTVQDKEKGEGAGNNDGSNPKGNTSPNPYEVQQLPGISVL